LFEGYVTNKKNNLLEHVFLIKRDKNGKIVIFEAGFYSNL
jgi:hypothetical protein